MRLSSGNLFADLPPPGEAEEAFTDLLARPGLRIERIVSRGQASPPGFWYDQGHDEWVALLLGSADLEIAGEDAPRRLGPGDHLLIPARCRHRVARTDDPTVWLAVHLGEGDDAPTAGIVTS